MFFLPNAVIFIISDNDIFIIISNIFDTFIFTKIVVNDPIILANINRKLLASFLRSFFVPYSIIKSNKKFNTSIVSIYIFILSPSLLYK